MSYHHISFPIYPSANKNSKKLQNSYSQYEFILGNKIWAWFSSCSGKMYHLRQFLILWDFHQNPPLQVNEIFDERNHKFFNDEFKNDLRYSRKPFEFKINLRDISWDDIFLIITCHLAQLLMCFIIELVLYFISILQSGIGSRWMSIERKSTWTVCVINKFLCILTTFKVFFIK